MWKKYELGLFKNSMSLVSKIILWIVFIKWVELLLIFGTNSIEIAILQSFIFLAMVVLIWGATKITKHRWPLEAWVYIKNLALNKPQELNYWVPDNVDEKEDRTKWIYKY